MYNTRRENDRKMYSRKRTLYKIKSKHLVNKHFKSYAFVSFWALHHICVHVAYGDVSAVSFPFTVYFSNRLHSLIPNTSYHRLSQVSNVIESKREIQNTNSSFNWLYLFVSLVPSNVRASIQHVHISLLTT